MQGSCHPHHSPQRTLRAAIFFFLPWVRCICRVAIHTNGCRQTFFIFQNSMASSANRHEIERFASQCRRNLQRLAMVYLRFPAAPGQFITASAAAKLRIVQFLRARMLPFGGVIECHAGVVQTGSEAKERIAPEAKGNFTKGCRAVACYRSGFRRMSGLLSCVKTLSIRSGAGGKMVPFVP